MGIGRRGGGGIIGDILTLLFTLITFHTESTEKGIGQTSQA